LSFAAALACSAGAARIILVPIDDRPATGQFAQMVGAIGAVQVDVPPAGLLGRFTTPGSPEGVLGWLERQDYSDVAAVVVSTDMVAYGGLIASREPDVDDRTAVRRLERLLAIRRAHPKVPFYAFATLTRVYPTASAATASWREFLGEYVMLRSIPEARRTAEQRARFARLAPHVPAEQLRRYDATRARNLRIDRRLVEMAAGGAFDCLLIGQDDAAPVGPHIREARILREAIESAHAGSVARFCEGIDQHACVLVSRAALRYLGAVPRVRVIYSDDDLSRKVADYESRPLRDTVEDQVVSAGAIAVGQADSWDYTLYVAIPGTGKSRLDEFVKAFQGSLSAGEPVALADIDFDPKSAMTARLAGAIEHPEVAAKLLAFGNWNTASNTVGTVVPAANLAIATRAFAVGRLYRETARLKFLAHRVFGDLGYNNGTRSAVYGRMGPAGRLELRGQEFTAAEAFARTDLAERSCGMFDASFRGVVLGAWGERFEVVGIDGLKIDLPWPRAFEVFEEFGLKVR
jgi:hypothetical protein